MQIPFWRVVARSRATDPNSSPKIIWIPYTFPIRPHQTVKQKCFATCLAPRYPPTGPSVSLVTGFWSGEMASLGIRFGVGLRVRECVLRLRCVVRVLVLFGGGVARVLRLGVCRCALFLRLPLRGRLLPRARSPVCLVLPFLSLSRFARAVLRSSLFLLLLVAGVRVFLFA